MLAHDFMNHFDYAYIHEWLTDILYLLNLLKHLYDYIHHCSQCQYMQTSRHKFYESMQVIFTFSWSFHILIINFILVLLISLSLDNYDIILLVISKFSKTVIFIFKWKIMTAKNWVICLMNYLTLLNWDLLQIILLNWDRKFTVIL